MDYFITPSSLPNSRPLPPFSHTHTHTHTHTYNPHTYAHTQPVNMFPPTSTGFHDVYGNVWEWTEDDFNGLPGFKTTYLYDDFSTPCFDGKHTMMMVRYITES